MDFRIHGSYIVIAAGLLLGAVLCTEYRRVRGELTEVIYMVTVPAGFPRAITASQALSKLFAERRAAPGKQP